jgi:hypothetical protein
MDALSVGKGTQGPTMVFIDVKFFGEERVPRIEKWRRVYFDMGSHLAPVISHQALKLNSLNLAFVGCAKGGYG